MKQLKTYVLAFSGLILITACKDNAGRQTEAKAPVHIKVSTPDAALSQLKEGNRRYVEGKLVNTDYNAQREETKDDQHPHTVILSCMDSRVVPELIFDQGLGNIFVTRVAGNVEDSNIIGSIEYATKVKGSKLLLVMGHAHCGAVKGSIDNVKLGNLTQLLAQIRPSVTGDTANKEAMIEETAKNNVKHTIADILQKSDVIAGLVKENNLKIVGAYYNLASGEVTFLE